MGFDIGGNTITLGGSALTINTGVSMDILSSGAVVRPNQPQFVAYGSIAAWSGTTPTAWNRFAAFSVVPVNVGNCFSGGRFTAPVDGMYFFQASLYIVIDTASDAAYHHPVFWVNGSGGVGTVNGSVYNYRIRGHGVAIASYHDGHITQIYQLTAGDYVDMYSYIAGTIRWYPAYSRFTGFLMG